MSEADFLDLPDLASETVGGAAIACNDESFALRENLLKPHPAEWREHEYTDRGKWMDGWETRRRREPGYDWCVIRLGMPGRIRGVVVDTAYFRGNYPAECSVEATRIDAVLDLAALDDAAWTEIVPRSPLRGDSKNLFAIAPTAPVTHVRLSIFPDGGVARLRIHGEVEPPPLRGLVDLAALDAGGWVESCSDMFFGSRNNLIRPGPSRIMADGWETRRRRGPGHDWALVRLAARGTVDELEIDTSHFKHNAPGRCLVEGRDQGGDWRPLVASPLQPHTRHRFAAELRRIGPITHVRLNVYPDGGVARLRVRGLPVAARPDGLAWLDAATPDEARAWLLAACGSRRWAERMTALRPFEDLAALLRLGEQTFWELGEDDLREAFAAHPKIGERKLAAHEAGEQAGAVAAGDAVRAALADRNAAYLDRFGFIYIVCASGRSAEEMLADLEARLGHDRATELRTAAEEQCKITRLRLARGIQEMVA